MLQQGTDCRGGCRPRSEVGGGAGERPPLTEASLQGQLEVTTVTPAAALIARHKPAHENWRETGEPTSSAPFLASPHLCGRLSCLWPVSDCGCVLAVGTWTFAVSANNSGARRKSSMRLPCAAVVLEKGSKGIPQQTLRKRTLKTRP